MIDWIAHAIGTPEWLFGVLCGEVVLALLWMTLTP